MNEKEVLLKRDSAWASAAAEAKDAELIASFWTEDAIVISPGMPPIVGRIALRQYVEHSFSLPGFRISWTSNDVVFSEDRTLAYMFSQNSVTMNSPEGEPVTTKGRAVTIWRKESDGEWRCAVDIWNS